MNQSFSKIWIIVVLVTLLAGGIFAWQYFRVPVEETEAPEEKITEEEKVPRWKTYRNEKNGFEIKYPKDWEVGKNIFSILEPSLVFCPSSLRDADPEVVCKLKADAPKPKYEEGMIYLFAYDYDPKPDNLKYHYLGSVGGKYYYLAFDSDDNESIVRQMLSTFRFLR